MFMKRCGLGLTKREPTLSLQTPFMRYSGALAKLMMILRLLGFGIVPLSLRSLPSCTLTLLRFVGGRGKSVMPFMPEVGLLLLSWICPRVFTMIWVPFVCWSGSFTWLKKAGSDPSWSNPHVRHSPRRLILLSGLTESLWVSTGSIQRPSMEICWLSGRSSCFVSAVAVAPLVRQNRAGSPRCAGWLFGLLFLMLGLKKLSWQVACLAPLTERSSVCCATCWTLVFLIPDAVGATPTSESREALPSLLLSMLMALPIGLHLALASNYSLVRAWFWKREGHINVLEQASAVSLLDQLSCQSSSVRFASLIDSAVCRGSLSKGRSASVALQPGLKKAGAICVAADLYPVWPYCPTRLNTADDPTRSVSVRAPVGHSLVQLSGFSDLAKASSGFLRRFAANWFRLVLLALLVTGSDSVSCGSEPGSCDSPSWIFDLVHVCIVGICLFLSLLGALWTLPWTSGETCRPERAPCWISDRVGSGRVTVTLKWTFNGNVGLVVRAMVLFCCLIPAGAMPIGACTAAEHARVLARAGNNLVSSRAVRPQTRDKRLIYLERFRRWLLEEKSTSLRLMLEQKPPDPEKVNDLLIEYGKQLYYGGKAYGIYAETVNAIAAERPLIRRQLTAAWDLAFCWLADEPTSHHPAMPLSIMTAMVTTALTWGWPYEAAVLMLSWAGVMRIGEVLCALRRDLVLPSDAAPGTSFALVIIRAPKTRGRSANHQAARIDQSDIIAFLTSMYGASPADSSIWPYSAATLRKRFVNLLNALELPTEKRGEARPFDLGSLRPGGATWLLHHTGDLELVRHRGR